jgi:hypothetical protein
MFGIGHWELIGIGVAVLIIFGTGLAVALFLVARKGRDDRVQPKP